MKREDGRRGDGVAGGPVEGAGEVTSKEGLQKEENSDRGWGAGGGWSLTQYLPVILLIVSDIQIFLFYTNFMGRRICTVCAARLICSCCSCSMRKNGNFLTIN